MNSISASWASRLTRCLVGGVIFFALLTGPVWAAGLPKPDVAIALRDGSFLHLAPLPFGSLAGAVVGSVQFDASGTRAIALARFPGAGIAGNWRSANPIQGFLVDAQRRIVTQLTSDGAASSIAWDSQSSVQIRDGTHGVLTVSVGAAAGGSLPVARFATSDEIEAGSSFVSGKSTDRLAVYKTSAGRYTVVQIGARRFRVSGIARNGAYAVIGSYLAWIDGQRHIARQVTRFGPDNAEPLNFSGSVYGDAIVPILPLGSPVYQASYRNGVAYFAFSQGVERIVAATNDLVNFWYPRLPHEPVFTVGEGFGRSADGNLYFVRPEEDVMLFTHAGHYVRRNMTGLDAARDVRPLVASMRSLEGCSGASAGTSYCKQTGALGPLDDALDGALAQWRFFPVGDASGERWAATRLGRLLIGDSSGRFVQGNAPMFPFALLGRTDDGRIWGAAPGQRATTESGELTVSSSIWWSRDAAAWHKAATVMGDAGAIGSHTGDIWVAATRRVLGRTMICVARLDGPSPELWPTAATFAGEELSFADLPSGFYLFTGSTPGWRLSGGGGPLSAFRVDASQLAAKDAVGNNPYVAALLAPDGDPSLPDVGPLVDGAEALLAPTLAQANSLKGRWLTLRTNIKSKPETAARVTITGLDQERAFELKYAATPYPLATVVANITGSHATVSRTLEVGPLHASGTIERWENSADGWHQRAVLSRFSY
jgi:hypothetical protein